ncbi:MAG TPA: hypothetical protein VJK54_00905 [Chthoniobacterales bacterium]|nr:hypothetical protein [Chthoniobacterales bacterium]
MGRSILPKGGRGIDYEEHCECIAQVAPLGRAEQVRTSQMEEMEEMEGINTERS